MTHSVWPIIRNCLGYSRQHLVDSEFACLCVIRVIDFYYQLSPENLRLETLFDPELITTAVNMLLLPAGASP
jgi:E3 ubiquitin-protein ligase TRIP12